MGEGSLRLIVAAALLAAGGGEPAWSGVPALFVFGDSLVDVGNNNFLPLSLAKANFPPNGVDFPGGRPTGRFSNGYNVADYLGKLYGFRRSPPPFLSLNEPEIRQHVWGGISYASAGSGILNSTGSTQGEVISMEAQLHYFRTSLKSFRAAECSINLRLLLSKAVFLLCTGSNDIFAFYNSNSSQIHLSKAELYRLGARRFGMVGLGLVGCCPSMRSRTPSGGCMAELNDLARQFNLALRRVLKSLSGKLKGMKYSFGDGQKLGNMIADDPSSFGFKDAMKACCGGGRLNGERPCNGNATVCGDAKEFYFWDWYHPTAVAASLSAQVLYDGPPELVFPVNFRQLAV
ncbi:unnamed protein product [Spirodela intermedia]|uniref:Uncharacterized protein n=1 Tax=Spirodela intermedia TaxID=51605 RepID=A0A7I8LL30_SPIIN|nr:unnamed protein product [Spirodela intermedia]